MSLRATSERKVTGSASLGLRLMDTISQQVAALHNLIAQENVKLRLTDQAAFELQNALLAISCNCELMLQRHRRLLERGGR